MGQPETYQIISLVCFGLGGIFLIAAVIIFFKLRIVEVIGELTGRTARRQIEAYRREADKKSIVSKSDGEETPDFPQIFQDKEEEGYKKDTGETILLIDSGGSSGDAETILLNDDGEEEEEKTAVMENRFQIVRDEVSSSSKRVVS